MAMNLPNFPDVTGDTVSADQQLRDFLIAVRTTLEKVTVLAEDTAVEAAIPFPDVPVEIESGTKMYFYQDTAPTDWTIDAGVADVLLAVKGGSNAYNTAGGAVAGSWTPTNHTHTGPSHVHTMGTHVHTTPGHVLTDAEMPSHNHLSGGAQRQYPNNFTYGSGTVASKLEGTSGPANISTGPYTSTVGSDSSHAHGDTGSKDPGDTNAGGTAATGGNASPSTDRPYGAVGIIATKD